MNVIPITQVREIFSKTEERQKEIVEAANTAIVNAASKGLRCCSLLVTQLIDMEAKWLAEELSIHGYTVKDFVIRWDI
jgi:hypothetical protein